MMEVKSSTLKIHVEANEITHAYPWRTLGRIAGWGLLCWGVAAGGTEGGGGGGGATGGG